MNHLCDRLPLFAEKILEDVKYSLSLLEVETDRRKFKLLWISTIVLLKSVGDALRIEAREKGWNEPVLKPFFTSINSSAGRTNPLNNIYHDFIQPVRNRLVHELEFDYLDSPIAVGYTSALDTESKLKSFYLEDLYIPRQRFDSEGTDVRDLIQEGIDWWSIKISELKDLL